MKRVLSLMTAGAMALSATPAFAFGNRHVGSSSSAEVHFRMPLRNTESGVRRNATVKAKHWNAPAMWRWGWWNIHRLSPEARAELREDIQLLMAEARDDHEDCREMENAEERRACAHDVRTDLRLQIKAAIAAALEAEENDGTDEE